MRSTSTKPTTSRNPITPRNRRAAALLVTATLGLGAACLAPITAQAAPRTAAAQATRFASGHGITVQKVTQVTTRTVELTISTPAVDRTTTHLGEVRVRVTLPRSYGANPGKRYPSLYLFHGQDGRYSDWTDFHGGAGGDLEKITDDSDLIVITPEGGRAGWYTDWVNNDSGQQQWETFHINQLIPFIDENLRTKADKAHRGVAGLSMGGFGAAHYATRHPELFTYMASFSGGLDLENQPVRTAVVMSSAIQHFFPADGSFGPVVWPNDGNWIRHNPQRNVGRLQGMTVSLYAGAKNEDVIEANAGWSTNTFSQALDTAGIEHRWDMYGRPGKVGDYTCDGGHNFGCWNMALNKELPRMMKALS